VETKAEKTEVAKTKRERSKRESRKETREKGREKTKKKQRKEKIIEVKKVDEK